MNRISMSVSVMVACVVLVFSGCAASGAKPPVTLAPPPEFSLAFSEYPSWSVFAVAHEKKLINGEAGKLGPIEEKWGIDLVLKQADYDTCLTLYGNEKVDAACLTNMDALAPSIGRPSVAVLPTSTSVGADACVVVGNIDIDGLKSKTTYGLEKSVSQYAFERNLVFYNLNPKDYKFKNMDPAAAAQAMQTNQSNIDSIMVWNPFLLQTLRTRKDSKVLFSSKEIPEEIIDCVIVGKDSLAKPKGEDFAMCVLDTYYSVNKLLADPAEHDSTLVAIGSKFSNLGLEDMKLVVEQTKFYTTPTAALDLFAGDKFQKTTMPMVLKFCVDHEIVPNDLTGVDRIGFNDDKAMLNFSTKYLQKMTAN